MTDQPTQYPASWNEKDIESYQKFLRETQDREAARTAQKKAGETIQFIKDELAEPVLAEIRARYAQLGLSGSPQESAELFQAVNRVSVSHGLREATRAAYLRDAGLEKPIEPPASTPAPFAPGVTGNNNPYDLIRRGLRQEAQEQKARDRR